MGVETERWDENGNYKDSKCINCKVGKGPGLQ